MSLYRELRPDPASLPIEIAMTSLEQSRRALTRPFGQAIVTNGAGGASILGAGGGDGLIPWVDDSEPPSRPTGLSAASTSQVITVHWDGTLEYGLPADFHSIEIHIQPDGGDDTVIGTLRVAGDVASGLLTEGDIVDVWAVALDDAHDRVGEWTPNRSEASDVITLVVEPVVSQDQLRDKATEILAAADESVKAQIEQVNKDLQDTSDRIDTKAEEILEAAKADATAKADAVDQKVQAANSKVQANADAIEAARGNARELLYNGGFEHGADGWTTNIASAGFAQQSPWCRSGGWRAYLNGSAGTRELVSTKPVAVTVGNRYRFRAWYKLLTALSGNDNGGLRLQYTSSTTVTDSTSWTVFTPLVNMQFTGNTWTQAIQEVVIPDGVKWVRARVAFTSPVNAYFDDCSIIDVTQLHELDVAVDEVKQAAALAQSTADGRNRIWRQRSDPALDADVKPVVGDLWWQTREARIETYWEGTPNNSVSVLVDHSDEIEHMWIWDGSKWNSHALYAQDLLVNGSVVTELLSATALYGKTVKGGVFLTSNERLVIDNEGLLLKDSGGNATITMLASNGSATFRDVNIIDGSLTTPSLISSDIQGGTVSGATVTGGTVQTVTDANRGIKMTGGNFDIYRADKTRFLRANEAGVIISDGTKNVLTFAPVDGVWTLSLAGAIQSGGEISSAVITAPTLQTSSAENTGLKLTTGGLVAYDMDGNTTFTLDNAGQIMMAGAVLSNATLTAPILQTNPAENRGIKIAGQTFTAYRNDGTKMVNIDVNGSGVAEFTGTFRTGSSGSVMEMLSYSSGVSSVQGGGQLRSVIGDKTIWNMWGHYGESGYAGQLWEYTWGLGVAGSDFLTAKVTNTGSQMFIQADTVRISSTTAGGGVYVNNRRIDWEQSWTNLPLANGVTAVGTAQYGQRAGLLVFRGRIKCTGSGDCDLCDLSAIYSGFETSSVNRTWIIGTMTNGLATAARAYIPANSTMLRVNNGPHDWVDIGSIVIGL